MMETESLNNPAWVEGSSEPTNNGDDTSVPSSSSPSPSATPYHHLTIQEKADELFVDSEILAPMVRASTTPLRTLALRYGADVVFSEEIVDRAITSNVERRVNESLGTIDYVRTPKHFTPKQWRKIQRKNRRGGNGNANKGTSSEDEDYLPVILRIAPHLERGRFVYQMGTGESNLALPAALAVERDVSGVDVNMGCPKKFSVSGGMGSALLSDVTRACDIIKTLRRNLTTVPVSAKIRLLKDVPSTIDFVRALEQAGANAITIHARRVGDESTTPARWEELEHVVSGVGGVVPTIVNGDMYTREDIDALKRRTGADGIMLARPALYNTSIFRTRRRPRRRPLRGTDDEDSGEAKDDAAEAGDDDEEEEMTPALPLLPKDRVVRDYVAESVRWKAHPKNVKYVVCEFMSNRRAPLPRVTSGSLPQNVYPDGRTIGTTCACKSLDDLCRLWDVNVSFAGGPGRAAASEDDVPTEQRYDDAYFLDHDAFRRGREITGRRPPGAITKEEVVEAEGVADGGGNGEGRSSVGANVDSNTRRGDIDAGGAQICTTTKRPRRS